VAQPKVEIQLSLDSEPAKRQANELTERLHREFSSLGPKFVSYEFGTKLFGGAIKLGEAFFNNALKNSEDLRTAVLGIGAAWDGVGKRFGDALAATPAFINSLEQIQSLVGATGNMLSDPNTGFAASFNAATRSLTILGDKLFEVFNDAPRKMAGLSLQQQLDSEMAALEAREPALIPLGLGEEGKKRAQAEADRQAKLSQSARERRTQETGRLLASGQLELPSEFGGGFEAGNQGDPLKIQRENMDMQARLASEASDTLADVRETELQNQAKYNAEQEKLQAQARQKFQKDNAAWIQLASQGSSAFSNGMASIVAAAASGQGDLDDVLKQAAGGMLTTIGQTLMQLGTAAILAGTLGTVIPIFAAATGGPAGVAAGVAALAGGAAMVAVGSALGGASSGGRAAVVGPAGPASLGSSWQPSRPDDRLGQFTRVEERQPTQQLVVNFPQGFVIGSKEQVAAGIRLAMQATQPGAVGWTG